MNDALEDLLDRNDRHVETLEDHHFDAVQDGQEPPVVSICCADSRVAQEEMFDVEAAGFLFSPSNIGNQAWDLVDGERVVNGNLLYPVAHAGTGTVVVVGHTGCGAVTAAYHAVQEDVVEPEGIAKWVSLLVPVVEDALASGAVDPDASDDMVVNQLVEQNVDRQVEFLLERDEIPDSVDVYGMVYDFQDVYGPRGRTVLINTNGETDPDALEEIAPADAVARLT